jgi:hypothetical protein
MYQLQTRLSNVHLNPTVLPYEFQEVAMAPDPWVP